jgi:pre-mRNA-processing factor SLU7
MEARRYQRDLEEARKHGLAPAAIDANDGQEINPHIPAFITQAPWYMDINDGAPTLKHQRIQEEVIKDEAGFVGYIKERKEETVVLKSFRKGACENCGALGHDKKQCLERPRKIAAKHALTNPELAGSAI